MGCIHYARGNRTPHRVIDQLLGCEVRPRRRPGYPSVYYLQVLRAAQDGAEVAEEQDLIPSPLYTRSSTMAHILENAHHAHGRCRVDSPLLGFVVQAHVPAHDRGPQGLAGLGHPLYARCELVVSAPLFGAAEVQAVSYGDRLGSHAREVAVSLGDGGSPAASRVEVAVTGPAVGGGGEAQSSAFDAY